MSPEPTNGHYQPRPAQASGRGCGEDGPGAAMREMCAATLGRPAAKVKMHRSFVAQGGDSLLAIKLMARCRDAGYDVTIHDILQAKSITELCGCLAPSGIAAARAEDSAGANGHSSPPPPPGLAVSQHVLGRLKTITSNAQLDVEAFFPCSPIQNVFLTAHGIRPELYQCTAVIDVSAEADSALDYPRLVRAWNTVVSRHVSLRTVFLESEDRPGDFDQAVLREVASLRDLGDVDEATAEEVASRQLVSFHPGAPLKAVLLRRGADSARLRVDISHALIDGESLPNLLRDLSAAYAGTDEPAPAMSYSDYASHQRHFSPDASVAYWSRYLDGAQPSFFPPSNDQAGRQDLRTERARLVLDPGALAEFCGRRGVTAANICQVAWALVLRSYTGSDDVCFSYVSSGRQAPLAGIDGAIGAFVDTMVCRMNTSGDRSLAQTLARARQDFTEGLPHPFVLAMNHEGRGGELSRLRGNTIISCLGKLPSGGGAAPGSGLSFELVDAVNPSEYDISLNIEISEDTLDIGIDFWESRITTEAAQAVSESLRKTLCSIITDGDTCLGDIDVVPLTHVERIREWNKSIPPRVESRIQDRVEENQRLRPGALAIQGWDGDLTYQELNDLADKLAAHLVGLGVRPETKVPLCVEKSKWAVVSQLAIMKASGCVVPISPNQPKKRTELILEDLGACILLTSPTYADRMAGMLPNVLVINGDFMSGLPQAGRPICTATPDNAAFIIYTSGSTGVPKGVVLPHGSLCTSLHYLGAKFELGTHTRMLQFSAYTFDISIQDIYTTLHYGGCLCIISEDDRLNNLGPSMSAYRVNCAGLTSTVASTVSPDDVPSLQTLVLLGEAVKPVVASRWLPHAAVYNAYGPSECSIQASCRRLSPACNALNIGHALAGALWVVDAADHNRLVPVGSPGELLIEGPLQARGYLNNREKTDEAFVTDPAWASRYGFGAGRRFYRTGDLVRQCPDGSIVYIGRRDTQVKFRGMRLEVGEIEHHLIRHHSTVDAAVVLPAEGPCKDRLVAVITLHARLSKATTSTGIIPLVGDQLLAARSDIRELEKHLAANVPEHMVPTVWIPLSGDLPQNESAKLDRKALKLWVEAMKRETYNSLTSSTAERGITRPSTLTEKYIQDAWADVLKAPSEQIPIKGRSFLGLGGDSIGAMRVVSQVRQHGVSLTVRDVLQCASIWELARDSGSTDGEIGKRVAPEPAPDAFALLGLKDTDLKGLQDAVAAKLGVQPEDMEDLYPCSPIQQGILMSQAKSPSKYQIQQIFKVGCSNSKGVSCDTIIGAWQAVVDRHPMLRSVFIPSLLGEEDGSFYQVVLRGADARAERLECEDSELASHLAVKTDPELGIHTKQPAHRLTVYSTPSGAVYCRLILNHALVDASSLALIQKDLVDAYDGKLAASTGPSYSAYISFLQRSPADESLQYWSEKLVGAELCHMPALTEGGFLRDAGASDRGEQDRPPMEMEIAELGDIEELQALCESLGITMANVFQLAWALILSKYTGSSDVSFGYLANGRDATVDGVDSMVGPLVNILVTRIALDPEVDAQEALRKLQDDFFEGYNHQRTSLLDIWHALGLKGGGLFNTSLSYRHANPPAPEGSGLSLDLIAGEDPTEYDVTVSVVTVPRQKISVWMQYSPDFMCRDAAAGLVGCLLQTVKSLVKHPHRKLADAQMVTPQDLSQVRKWNEEIPAQDADECIHEIVACQRRLRPAATAVCAWDGNLTYSDLEDAADRLAGHLVTNLKVGIESKVALCLDKSKWAVVAQLAVLRAGGVVVSINPKHPLERLEVILRDTGARVMITTRGHSSRFSDLIPRIVEVGPDGPQIPALSTWAPTDFAATNSENAAFIIYTSGSTGTPKGVVLTHSSLVANFRAHGSAFGMGPDTRTIQFASYTFDASISDIWATICHGGCVCVISEDERMNGFEAAIRAYRGTLSQLTPTVASLLDLSKLPSLRTLVLGGEAVRPSVVEAFMKSPSVTVMNGYGPAECSIYTTCGRPLRDAKQAVVIGRPLLGSVWVVNEDASNISPVGAVGELWIGGPLLAREYLNDKDKTERSFVRDPLWARRLGLSSQRFYRTGDLVRQARTGDIVYIARKDTQGKIRGQRVETGEIEYQVKKCFPAAKGAVAILLTLPGGGNDDCTVVSVAFELDNGVQAGVAGEPESLLMGVSGDLRTELCHLRTVLSDALPSYMVPSVYVPVTRFPINPSGKVDRRALTQMLRGLTPDELSRYSLSEDEKVAPATETEKKLQAVWAAVLNIPAEEIGANDHFLHSGGDSFLAMRLVGRSSNSGLPLTVADVFSHPKLADMARAIDQKEPAPQPDDGAISPFALWNSVKDRPASIEPEPHELAGVANECGVPADAIEDVYPCTPLQDGLIAMTSQRSGVYVGRWAYRIPDAVDLERFKHAWEQLVTLAPILRTRIVPGHGGSGALQVVVREEATWFSDKDLGRYLRMDAELPIAYGSRLMRLAVVEPDSARERFFVLTLHHSLYDGLSFVKMFETASRLYSSQEVPSAAPYTAFIRHLQEQDTSAAESFWRAQLSDEDLSGSFPSLPTPSHQPRPSQITTHTLRIGNLTGDLTPAIMLRAAWALAVSPYVGSSVLFATTLSGRAVPVRGIMDMLAPTITTVPLNIRIDRRQSVREFLDAVRRQSIDMMPFEHTGLQNIRRLVGKDIEPQHLFAVQSATERERHLSQNPMGLELVDAPMQDFYSYALTVECTTDGSAVEVEARYDQQVLSALRVRRLLGRFEHVLSQLVGFCNRAVGDGEESIMVIGDIETVSPEEVVQLARWNEGVPAAQEVLIHDLVRKNCSAQPDQLAVCSWDGELTYRELDLHSDALAQRLVRLGVGPEAAVPVCLEKSKWVPVAQLAVLKAGGVIVPVRADPAQRLYGILEDTRAEVALITGQYAPQLRERVSHVLVIDDAFFEDLEATTDQVEGRVHPGNAAYIIYTSGSTGTPKGVVLEHRSMATSLLCQVLRLGLSSEIRAFQFSHFTFDASVHDMFATLLCGGCVCLPSEEERVNDLAGAMRRMGANYALLTPAVLATLRPSDVPSLHTITIGGDIIREEHVGGWLGHARLLNGYGPTECSIMVSLGEVVAGHTTCIGRNLATGLWVVDAEEPNRLLPPGAKGELLVEGPGIAREYLNDTQKTSAAFLEDPAWLARYDLNPDGATRRMYRTGDVVVQNDDGSLTYVGRKDSQIKIRGQRVEPSEIEHHITKQRAVDDAVVLYPRQGPARGRLVGVLTLREFSAARPEADGVKPVVPRETAGALEQVSSVRDSLAEDIPEYMVPTEWVLLESMPQNTSGKVDRTKLVNWLASMDDAAFNRYTGCGGRDDASQPGKPETVLEARLQSVFADVLHLPVDRVPLTKPFLSMGGDSITAMQVVSQCRSRHGITVLVRDVLQSRSIRQLVLNATDKNREVEDGEAGSGTEFELSPIQRLYFRDIAPDGLRVQGDARFNQSVCLSAQAQVTIDRVTRAVKRLVERHDMLRARFRHTAGGLRQSVAENSETAFRLGIHEVDGLSAAEDIIARSQRGLDLQSGPVFSADWIQIPALDKKLLFLTAHHLVIDLVSWRIISQDLETLLREPDTPLAARSMSFRRWTQLQAQHVQALEYPEEELSRGDSDTGDWEYWGMTPGANAYGDRVQEQFTLSKDETSLLFSDAQPLRTEPVDALIAGLLHSFRKTFPDRPAPTVFNEGHGRQPWSDAIDLSSTVGWFTTMSPVRVRSEAQNLIDVLAMTKDARRTMSAGGVDYLASRFLTSAGMEGPPSDGNPEIAFNYTGRFQQLEGESRLLRVDPTFEDNARLSALGVNVKRLALFEFEASVQEGRLHVRANFNRKMQKQDDVRRWIRSYASSLRDLTKLSGLPLTFTLSDFPSLDVTYEQLSRLQSEALPRAGVTDLRNVEDIYPCSPIQQGILLSQVKGYATYQTQQVCEIQPLRSPSVDVDHLSRAWKRVVDRHAILRTIFLQSVSAQNLFYQVVLRSSEVRVPRLHCSGPDDVASAFSRGGRPEYADNESPNSMAICTTADGRTYVRFDFNHALMDASSLEIIFHDLVRAYDGLLAEATPAPSYRLHISFLQRTPATESLAYWTDRLRGAQPCHLLPSTSPATETRSLKRLEAEVDAADLRLLQSFRTDHGVTVANVVQLAWGLVLSRYTGSKDVLFGYVANGRDEPIDGVEQIVGPMINMLVSRIRLPSGEERTTAAEAAGEVQNNTIKALDNQRTSLGDIQHALHVPEQSLFNTTLSYIREAAGSPPEDASLRVRSVSGEDPTEYDVNVTVVAGDDIMKLFLQYSTSFLDNESAQCILESFQHALRSISASGRSTPLNDLQVASPSDVARIRRWNSNIPPALEGRVADKIQAQAQARPGAPAVCGWDGQLTYSELDVRAEQLARRLADLGVGEGHMVGLCFEKSMWAIVAMLGVLRAGGVVVPLGFQHPSERLRLVLEDTKSAVVLTSQLGSKALEGAITAGQHQVLMLGASSDVFAQVPGEALQPRPPANVGAESAAVVIYTSGSTGRPKGVVITQSSLFNSLEAHGRRLGFSPSTRALQFSSYVFDVSLLDILGVLQFGGCVCVVSEEDRLDVRGLAARMDSMQVNCACLTPTMASLLDPAATPTLRTLFLIGEQVPSSLVEMWLPHAQVYNVYGPAECTIASTINGPITDRNQASNIGSPVAAVVWVVDPEDIKSLVPLGAVGELLIEGPIVSRGYLNQPEITASSFVTDPLLIPNLNLKGRRMYRTGDLVRQSPGNGSLTYIGRRDGQVKMRGLRIELGEIEHAVKKHFSAARMVAAGFVTPCVNKQADPRLAVALTLHGHERDDTEHPNCDTNFLPITPSLHASLIRLQNALANVLPSFMVPSLYVPLREIPLTASGKLDRVTLRTILQSLEEQQLLQYSLSDAHGSESLSETGSRLKGLWAEALGSPAALGANSHFFRAGGDSVTAMRLVALARDLTPPLPLRISDVFQTPVLSDMARTLDSRGTSKAADASVSKPFSMLPAEMRPSDDELAALASQCNLKPGDVVDVYPCTPLQEGLFAVTSRHAGEYVNRWVFRVDEGIEVERLKDAWRQIFELVPIMRSRIVDNATLGPVNVETTEPMDFPTIHSDLGPYLEKDAADPMGFGTRLMRFAILDGPTGRFFVWTAHHSVYDGWMVVKLLDAVAKAYSGQVLPSFRPFTCFVDQVRQANSRPEVRDFWAAQLKGHAAPSFPDTSVLRSQHCPTYLSLSRDVTLASAPDKFTLATLLRATWGLIVSKETGTADVSFPTPVSGRTAAVDGILDVMGPTITTVPVRIRVDRTSAVTDFLAAVQQQSVDMIPFEHAGLQNIRQFAADSSLDFNHLFVVQPSAERVGASEDVLPGLTPVPREDADLRDYPLLLVCNIMSADGVDHGVELCARFDEGVLSREKVEAVLEQFGHVLSQLRQAVSPQDNGAHPVRISDLDLISPLDMRKLRAWNHGCPPPQLSATMHDLVHRKSVEQPDAAAVSSFDGELNYSELDALASRLAHHLRDIGVRTETPVGLMFEKTKWAVVAKLATLKAGGTIVALNHKHPRHRIEGILEATQAKVLLASRQFDLCQDLEGRRVTVVDQQLLDGIPDRDGSPCDSVRPDNAAFVLFTSGSTGKPKGVVLEHGSVASNLLELGARCGSGPESRVLQFSAFTFDLSIAEIFSTLFHGGCVCLISEEDRMSDLAGAMEAARVNTAWLTPTVAGLLTPRDVPSVRSILFAGEALKVEALGRWIDTGVKLFNGYGPTEASVVTSVNGPIAHTEDPSNIGRALSGMNLWVVDPTDYHQLVPVGNVGELLIDGSVLAREYLGDPKKTADAFVTRPSWLGRFHSETGPSRRFYRTGDLVQQTQDGTLVYVGRRDTQIKIHGQRVEIGEIESWIKTKLPDAREAAVGMLTAQRGGVLAAAIETATSSDAPSGDIPDTALLPLSGTQRAAFMGLQKALADVLPTYMVPQLYLPVSRLPLTQSGKLDRKAIWEFLQQQPTISSYLLVNDAKLPPSTDTERQLQALWAETLNLPLEEVGASDDFFTLGGDSILAMRMIAKTRRGSALQSLAVADLFQHRALSVIAGVLDEKRAGDAESILETTYKPFSALGGSPSQSIRESLTALLDSQGIVVDAAPTTDFQALSVNASLQTSRDLMAYASFDGAGPCDVGHWRDSCLKLIESHEILRTAYVLQQDRLLQVVLQEYRPEIAHYEVNGDQTIDAFTRDLINRDMHSPPRLGRPFAEFAIVTSSTGDSRHRVLFRLSHGEYDSIAISYFLESLRCIYDKKTVPGHTGFCNYVASITGGGRPESHRYWRDLLQGSSMPQFNRPSHAQLPSNPALVHYASFQAKLPGRLPPGVTHSGIIRAAWARVLSLHTGSRDVVFGEVVSGRNTGNPVAERASGCCANIVPVRVPFGDSWSSQNLLNYLRDQQVSRLPHEVLGFRETLKYCKCASSARPFTSRINHLDAPPQSKLAIGRTVYDFSISITEGASDFSDVSVTSVSMPDAIQVSMGYLEGFISSREAGRLLGSLHGEVDRLLKETCSTGL